MKKLLFVFALLIYIKGFSQEDTSKWRVIPSVTDWINEINNWPDSIYRVKNIRILIDEKKDSLVTRKAFAQYDSIRDKAPIIINKRVQVDGWDIDFFFGTDKATALDNILFKERVGFRNFQGFGIALHHITFEKRVSFSTLDRFSYWSIRYCDFIDEFYFFDINREVDISISDSRLERGINIIRNKGNPLIRVTNSEINDRAFLGYNSYKQVLFTKSKFSDLFFENMNVNTALYVYDCEVGAINLEGAKIPVQNTYIPFELVKDKLYVPNSSVEEFPRPKYKANTPKDYEIQKEYDLLIASYKLLLDSYQVRGDNQSYNACYVEMRDKETAYFKYVLDKEYSFDNFLTYQLNVFLRAFSDYGTKPTKAISFSIYVILFFALIYLLFPNSWDSLGKKRLMHRFEFFQKYLRRKEGMHTLYLEDKQQEISSYEEFKINLEQAHLELPSFFVTWSKPLYNASMFSSRITSRFLKLTDVLQGKWQDLTPKQKRWKNVQIGFLLTIGLFYDLFIKILNALMLSINTFTTLGFGEIPIKGLPRYLAIIQGFIGWFMLTIFSVSLISQLLN